MMKTIAFFNVKGGVGKTTTATTVAHLLATKFKQKVLLIDLDPQSNTTNLFSSQKLNVLQIIQDVFINDNINSLQAYENSVGDLLLDSAADVRKCVYKTDYENLSLIPATLELAEIEEQIKANIKTPQQTRLKNHLEKISNDYDYCVLDLSPSINLININGLVMTDYVFTPLRCDVWGLSGYCIAKNLINTVSAYAPNLKLGGCFFVQWNAQASLSRQIRELMSSVDNTYIDIPIRKSVKVEEMTYENKALGDYAPKATSTIDYIELTKHIFEKY